MLLSNADVIDYLGIEKETGCVVVTLVDDCDWRDETAHLTQLQRKLNRYFDFIDRGEVFQQVAAIAGYEVAPSTPVKMSILARYEPQGEGRRFLEHVAKVALEAGVGFAFKVVATP